MSSVLVCTEPHDITAFVTIAGLNIIGASVTVFMPGLMPYNATHSFFIDDQWKFAVSDGDDMQQKIISQNEGFDSIWFRRTGGSTLSQYVVEADDEDGLKKIHTLYSRSILALIDRHGGNPKCLYVNEYSSKLLADSKIVQLINAKSIGFRIPITYIGNDPKAIRDFQHKIGSPMICKPFAPHGWQSGNSLWQACSAILPDAKLISDETLRVQPAIYQPYVSKKYEIRAVLFGGKEFSIKINSQATERSSVDWRMSSLRGVACEICELPTAVVEKCQNLLVSLGLTYGAFDFIVTNDDEYIFLEVNEAGQFLFLEELCPELKILDAFCHFLKYKSLDDWRSSSAILHMTEVEKSVDFLNLKQSKELLPLPDHYRCRAVDEENHGLGALAVRGRPEPRSD